MIALLQDGFWGVIVLCWAMLTYGVIARDRSALNLSVVLCVIALVVALAIAFAAPIEVSP